MMRNIIETSKQINLNVMYSLNECFDHLLLYSLSLCVYPYKYSLVNKLDQNWWSRLLMKCIRRKGEWVATHGFSSLLVSTEKSVLPMLMPTYGCAGRPWSPAPSAHSSAAKAWWGRAGARPLPISWSRSSPYIPAFHFHWIYAGFHRTPTLPRSGSTLCTGSEVARTS